jgi:predicted DNA-binding transcriptional regulator AlpA
MTCREIRELIAAFLDDECAPDLRAEIESHIAACSECRAEVDAFKELSTLFRSKPLIQPSDSWLPSLERKLLSAKLARLTDELFRLRRTTEQLSARIAGLEQAGASPRPDNDLMTVDELAAYLRVTPQKVYEIMDDLPRIEMNYEVRFRRSSIDQWLKLREVSPAGVVFEWSHWVSGSRPSLSS